MQLTPERLAALLPPVVGIARAAGREIMRVYESEFAVSHKEDKSPLTEADLASERCIGSGLAALTPDIPMLGEESVATHRGGAARLAPALAGGSARRHARVRQAQRRVHGQHRADRRPRGGAGRDLRPGPGPALHRGARQRRFPHRRRRRRGAHPRGQAGAAASRGSRAAARTAAAASAPRSSASAPTSWSASAARSSSACWRKGRSTCICATARRRSGTRRPARRSRPRPAPASST